MTGLREDAPALGGHIPPTAPSTSPANSLEICNSINICFNVSLSRPMVRSPCRAGTSTVISLPPCLGHFCCYLDTKSFSTLCDPMDCSTPGFPDLHYCPEFAQTHVHGVGDAIQPSHPLSLPSPPALNPSQHHGLFQ